MEEGEINAENAREKRSGKNTKKCTTNGRY
jgi:hypothetical protein